MNGHCGQPIKSRPGHTCTNLASRDVKGVECCGKHVSFLVRKNDVPPPPSFVPFDCSICMGECKKDSDGYTTICAHKFHKACLWKWERSRKKVSQTFTCPICRKNLRQELNLQLELMMASLLALNQENATSAVAHLVDLISQSSTDEVADAVDRLCRQLVDRRVRTLV
jgi:hypothetical protein